MGNPLVTIVIPVYNGARFLREAVESALGQTYRPVEIVAVDDGSTDDSAAILAAYGGRITVVHQANAGVAAARNRGIAAGRGPWVAFLDQDDLWDPRKLETQLLGTREGDDVIHCNARVIDEAGNVVADSRSKPQRKAPPGLANIIAYRPMCMCTVLVRRDALLSVEGFDSANRFGTDDWQLWLALAATGRRFRYVDQVLASYRVHGSNVSSDWRRMMAGNDYALGIIRSQYPRAFDAEAERACRRRRQLSYLNVAWEHYEAKDYAQAAHYYWIAARENPYALRPWFYAAVCRLPLRQLLLPRLRALASVIRRGLPQPYKW